MTGEGGHADVVLAQLRQAEENGTLPDGGRRVCSECEQRLLVREGEWLVCPDNDCAATVAASEVDT